MKALKTKSLYAAVIAGLGAAGSMQAGAVNISQDNTGQVLLYPYYTVRGGFVTSLSVVNTDQDHTKAVKVRFLEGRNSAEVLDFNLFMSPRDVWTASVVDNGTGAAVFTTDRSCTSPAIGATAATAQPFSNAYYTGAVGGTTFEDNGGISLDRTREGYVEIIEMGVVANGADAAASPATPVGNTVATAVKHANTGIPANCNTVRANGLFPGAGDLRQPVGGLVGSGIIISGATGTEFAFNPVALANFFVDTVTPTNDLYSDSGSLNPDLRNVSPARSDVFVDGAAGTPAIITDTWATAIDAVSAVFMRSAIINDYDVSTGFKTDWVITAPTKRFYVQAASTAAARLAATALAVGPFNTTFASATLNAAQSCDVVFPTAYDREEAPYAVTAGVVFSPVPAGGAAGTGTLCYESTVLTVVPNGGTAAAASVFASTNQASLTLPANGANSGNYINGWVALYPTRGAAASNNGPGQGVTAGNNAVTGIPVAVITNDATGGLRNIVGATSGLRYRGLPVIGFGAVQGVVGGQGYGGLFDHKYFRNII
jgi:hypothetical protein